MSLTSLIAMQVVETIAGHRANGFMADGSITADDARAYVGAAKLLADIELKAMAKGALSTADSLKALDARLKAVEGKGHA